MGWGECTHSMRTHGSALPGAESTPPRMKPHGSAMTPQPTQIFASVTADAPTDPAPSFSFSRVRSASWLDMAAAAATAAAATAVAATGRDATSSGGLENGRHCGQEHGSKDR